jgi:uncharacterized membrane protein (DUF2068 family)
MARASKKIAPWEDIILRVIAIYKILHGLFFIAVGIGLIKLKHQNIPKILNDYVIQPLQLPPESKLCDWALSEASKITPHWITLASDAVFVYALLFLAEGVGLYLRKHWAEYFVVIVTGSLLPFEIWAMVTKVEWWKGGLILGNLLIVVYLIHRIWLDRHNAGDAGDDGDGKGPGAPPPRGQPRPGHAVSNGRS